MISPSSGGPGTLDTYSTLTSSPTGAPAQRGGSRKPRRYGREAVGRTSSPMEHRRRPADLHPRRGAGARWVEVATVENTTPGRHTMDLFDIDDAQRMSREEAAAKLHTLADALAKNNSVEFHRAGRQI